MRSPLLSETDRRLDTQAAAWDAFVEATPGGDVVQTSAWARSKRAIGLGTRLVVVRDGGGEIAGGALILLKRVAPGLCAGSVARGPLLRDASVDAAHIVDRVLSEARGAGVRFLIAQPPEGCGPLERALVARGFDTGCPGVAPEATIRLDLRRTDAELMADMTPMRRRNLRKRDSASLEIAQEADVDLFQRLHAGTAARQGFGPLDVATLRAQWAELAPSGGCAILIARHRGVPVSGIWLTMFAGVTTFRIAGWDVDAAARAGAPKHANEALHWAAIRWARASGAHTHDFGGLDRQAAEAIVAEGTPPDGFSRTAGFFKYGFGGSTVLLPVARWRVIGREGPLVRPLVRRMLASDRARSLMARARNG
jgi:peptidoglycan pentaglycine glycine transferase (the first glycine)